MALAVILTMGKDKRDKKDKKEKKDRKDRKEKKRKRHHYESSDDLSSSSDDERRKRKHAEKLVRPHAAACTALRPLPWPSLHSTTSTDLPLDCAPINRRLRPPISAKLMQARPALHQRTISVSSPLGDSSFALRQARHQWQLTQLLLRCPVQAKKIARHLESKDAGAAAAAAPAETMGPYTAAPTATAAPSTKFVWTKKIENDLTHGGSIKDYTARAEREKQEERLREIEAIQKRREQREVEKAQREEEMVSR